MWKHLTYLLFDFIQKYRIVTAKNITNRGYFVSTNK